jgi:hypothetical protein
MDAQNRHCSVETVGQAYLEILRARGSNISSAMAAPTRAHHRRTGSLPPIKKPIRCRLRCHMSSSR